VAPTAQLPDRPRRFHRGNGRTKLVSKQLHGAPGLPGAAQFLVEAAVARRGGAPFNEVRTMSARECRATTFPPRLFVSA
jgi:hypothetical protein